MTMASLNLLDINVDALFEQYSISEIDQIHKKLKQSIEEKKEELRMMVGERYRDLLQAADTIAEMKTTSADVVQHIAEIIVSCRIVNEQQLLGVKPIASSESVANSEKVSAKRNHERSCIGQIHLLTLLPELIWTRLDDGNYFVATQLFIFSRHISTGLQLDTTIDVFKRYPIARRQWNHLNQFFFLIKQKCLDQLERSELNAETAVKCLASLLLLDNCQLDQLLTIFIQSRTRAFRQTLSNSDSGNADGNGDNQKIYRAKDRVLASLKILNETIELLFTCFIELLDKPSSDGTPLSYLMMELESITGSNARPTISLINLENSMIVHALPSLVAKFKPQLQIKSIEASVIKRVVGVWIEQTKVESKQCLKNVIDNVGSIRAIHSINQAVAELETPTKWSEILQQLQLTTKTDFYEMLYKPLVQERIKTIVKSSWTQAIKQTEEDILSVLDADDVNWTTKTISSFAVEKSFWAEESCDEPLSLKQALSSTSDSHKLLMKTKGFSRDICNICRTLDANAEAIYNDLVLYLNATDDYGLTLKQDKAMGPAERQQIVTFLSVCSQDGITELISNVKSLAPNRSNQTQLIFLAALLRALNEICPNVKRCLMPASMLLSATFMHDKPSNAEQWDRVSRLLDEEMVNLWKRWIDTFIVQRLQSNGGHCFATDIKNLLAILPKWETISVEEKDDSNQIIASNIRVPNQISLPLQQFLFDCCRQLTKLVPHTLSRQVTALLADRLVTELVHTYTNLYENNASFMATSQNGSLQFYFDLKCVALLFLGGRRHDELDTLTGKFKANIDPFDFEMFHKYINSNIKTMAQRMQHVYGVLLPNVQHLNSILATISKANAAVPTSIEKDPNVLPLCANETNTHWFIQLPLVVPSKVMHETTMPKSAAPTVRTDKSKSPNKATATTSSTTSTPSSSLTAQQNLANVKSNAAALFSAMSQDWFR